MVKPMKESGSKMLSTVKEDRHTIMAMCMLVVGRLDTCTGKECLLPRMARNLSVNGQCIASMGTFCGRKKMEKHIDVNTKGTN